MSRVELLVSHRVPPRVADRGMLARYGRYRGKKIMGQTKTSTAALRLTEGSVKARERKPKKKKSPGPPGWGLCEGPATRP